MRLVIKNGCQRGWMGSNESLNIKEYKVIIRQGMSWNNPERERERERSTRRSDQPFQSNKILASSIYFLIYPKLAYQQPRLWGTLNSAKNYQSFQQDFNLVTSVTDNKDDSWMVTVIGVTRKWEAYNWETKWQDGSKYQMNKWITE